MFNFFKKLFTKKEEPTKVEEIESPKVEAPYKIEPPTLSVHVTEKSHEPVLSKAAKSEQKQQTLGEYLSTMHTEDLVKTQEKKPAKKKTTKSSSDKKATSEKKVKSTPKAKKSKQKV